MQFLVVFTPKSAFATGGLPTDFPEVEQQEQAQTRVLYAEGGLRQVWALQPKGRGAAGLFEAHSPEHLQEILATFPLIQAGYADAAVHGLAPHPAFTPAP